LDATLGAPLVENHYIIAFNDSSSYRYAVETFRPYLTVQNLFNLSSWLETPLRRSNLGILGHLIPKRLVI
jgi:hypothetical protein